MNEVHFYSSKIKSFFLLIISGFFTFSFIYFYDDLKYKNLFKVIILYLGFALFLFGVIYSMILLLRRKPLLSVTDTQIIIYDILRKPVTLNFKDISSFYVVSTHHRGLKTNEQICIITTFQKKKANSFLNRNISKIFPSFSYVQYGIQTSLLNVKTNELLKLLNKRLHS
ncbi:STM3941 family protein [Chryseobacterium daecheongense]|uniref:STM3941 family protein n=1 Tax=Chryseobacterium daecheongense TaxID=192389 RepID=UPI00374D4B31